jgi:hypothetical protein
MQRRFWFALCFLFACGGSDSTTGHAVALQTAMHADAEIAGPFMTETGWTVQLTKAAVSVGGLYYFDGEPAFVQRRSPRRWLASVLGLGVARAHPGHYIAGTALGQMTTPAFADLLAGMTTLPAGNGLSGDYRSARFKLGLPTSEPALSTLGGNVAIAEGVARNGTQEVHFKFSASYEDVARSVSNGEVDGCAFEEFDVETDGTVTVRVIPHVWFNLVDFAGIAAGSASAPTEPPAGSTIRIAFALGVAQLSAYRFSFTPQTP